MAFLNINGININYEIKGEGESLIFIHGLGSSGRDWEYQVNDFATKYKVITFDLRGHGQSDKPNEPYTISMFANDSAKLIEQLSSEPVHMVGHSLGGMVAFQLVVDYPKLVKSLTIVNSAPAVIFPSFKFHLGFFLRRYMVKFFGLQPLAVALANKLFPSPAQSKLHQIFIQRLTENSPQAYINSLLAFRDWNILDKISTIQCPTL